METQSGRRSKCWKRYRMWKCWRTIRNGNVYADKMEWTINELQMTTNSQAFKHDHNWATVKLARGSRSSQRHRKDVHWHMNRQPQRAKYQSNCKQEERERNMKFKYVIVEFSTGMSMLKKSKSMKESCVSPSANTRNVAATRTRRQRMLKKSTMLERLATTGFKMTLSTTLERCAVCRHAGSTTPVPGAR